MWPVRIERSYQGEIHLGFQDLVGTEEGEVSHHFYLNGMSKGNTLDITGLDEFHLPVFTCFVCFLRWVPGNFK